MYAQGVARQSPPLVVTRLNKAYNHAAAYDSCTYEVHTGRPRKQIHERQLPLKLFDDVVLLD